MTKTKTVKVKILPPAPQEVFFQETQFDEELPGRGSDLGKSENGSLGTDPTKYYNFGSSIRKKEKRNTAYASKARETKLKNAEKVLEGHENKKEIMKILKSGL